ncbi:MAG: acyltransferase [Methylocystis sp.]|nr:acyltransferase [Methylocystis sp.]
MMVCLSHAPFFLGRAGEGASWLAVPALGVGVDLFFAISGFVVALSLRSLNQRSGAFGSAASAFYIRRLGRIIPLCWTLLIVMGVFAIARPQFNLPWADLISTATFTANGHFGRCFAGAAGCGSGNLLHHTWSLALELQFYLVAPALFLIPVPVLRALTLAVLFIGLFFLRPWQTSLAWAFRIEAPLLGFWIGREWIARNDWRWACRVPALRWPELIGLLTVMALLPGIMIGPLSGLGIVSVAAIAGWIVVRSALSTALLANEIAVRIGSSLGAWSYAIYLIHPPLMIAIGWSGLASVIGFSGALVLSMTLVITASRWLTRAISDPAYRAARRFTERHLLKERLA